MHTEGDRFARSLIAMMDVCSSHAQLEDAPSTRPALLGSRVAGEGSLGSQDSRSAHLPQCCWSHTPAHTGAVSASYD